jgi:hypothetical protein
MCHKVDTVSGSHAAPPRCESGRRRKSEALPTFTALPNCLIRVHSAHAENSVLLNPWIHYRYLWTLTDEHPTYFWFPYVRVSSGSVIAARPPILVQEDLVGLSTNRRNTINFKMVGNENNYRKWENEALGMRCRENKVEN